MTESVFVDLMAEAIAATDGTKDEALTMFELQLLERDDPRLVWDLFESVRAILLGRLYRMAQYQITRDSEAQPIARADPRHTPGAASEPLEAADSPVQDQPSLAQNSQRHSAVSNLDDRRRKITPSHTKRNPRSQTSAQNVLMNVGGRKSKLDSITNQAGTPVGSLTYYGLANMHDETAVIRAFVHRLMESGMPKSHRQSDVARKFYTPDDADRMWLDCLKAVA